MATISNIEIQRLAAEFQLSLGLRVFRAILGDENGRVDVPGQPGNVYIRYQTANGFSPAQIVPLRAPSLKKTPGAAVIIERDFDHVMCIKRIDFTGQVSAGTNPTINNAADDNAAYWISQQRIVTLASHPISSAADSMEVTVQPWSACQLSDNTFKIFYGEKVDLTSSIPAGAGEWCIACLFLKTDMTIEVVTSTAKTNPDTLGVDDIEECLAARSTDALPVWAWRLYNGQTGITPGAPTVGGDDFWDIRGIVNSLLSSGSGSGITQLTGDVTAGPGSGSQAATLANSGVSAGSYTNASVTFDAKGRATAASSGATPAPANATYITQTPDATLSAEQALSALATGLMKVTTTTGVVSSVTDSAGLAGVISDETGTGALVFANTPTLTTPIVSGENVTDFIDYIETTTPSTPSSDHAREYLLDDQGFSVKRFIDAGGQVFQDGRDIWIVARNTTGSTITKGQIVNVNGQSNGYPSVALADANASSSNDNGLATGFVNDTAINNSYFRLLIKGILTDIDTSGLTAGNAFFLSTTPGAFTSAEPAIATAWKQRIGTCLVSHATAGVIWVNIEEPSFYSLYLGAFSVGSGSAAQIDLYGTVSRHGTIKFAALTADRTATIPNVDGNVVMSEGATVLNDAGADVDTRFEGDTDANAFYLDASADSIGIGTNAPTAKLDVRGTVTINEAGGDFDVRIEGDTDANLFFTDASTDRVGVGTNTPTAKLNVEGAVIINDTSADVDVRIESNGDANNFFSDGGNDNIGMGTGTPDASAKIHVVSTSKGGLARPVMTAAQVAAISSPAEGLRAYASDNEHEMVYDGVQWRAYADAGWTPYAFQLGFVPTAAFTTGIILAANGGSIAIPVIVQGHMKLEEVTIRQTATSLAREWGWDLYEDYLNNSNTLTRVANSNGTDAFTPGAASTRTLGAASAPVYLAPGLYWIVIQCRHATNTFGLANQAGSAAFAPNTAQTKTTTNPNGSTLDFVAATWVAVQDIYAVRLNGRVFGRSTAF